MYAEIGAKPLGMVQFEEKSLTVWTVPPCHPEPMRFAQGKLREGSVASGSEILRCAQHDRAGPCLNKEGQPWQNRWTKPAYSTSCVQNMLHWRQYWLRWTRRS